MRVRPEKIVDGRFEIGQVAGSGGMGVVYRAHDQKTGRDVALKVLLQHEQGPADRFAHEVQLVSALDHPHIIGYVSNGFTADGAPYLVMPWLDGIDLQERLKAGPLSIEETLDLARHVADALACLHGHGFVHRDLKPSNLFLPGGKVENVQVIDLGVARSSLASQALTLSGSLIGTPGYIAPEQARGDRDVAPSVDIFAFGCVLFECLTGRRLFDGAHLMAVLAKILLEDAPRVSELRPDAPPALDFLVHRMVAKDPEKRPRDGAELAKRLADLDRESSVDSAAFPRARAITESERRVLTVLVIVLPPQKAPASWDADETRVEAHPVYSSSVRFGVRAHLLADRMAVVLAPERASAADQAAELVRFARHVTETFSGAKIALTTGSAVTGARVPVGEVIERAVSIVRAPSHHSGVQIDEVTSALISSRFDVRREEGGLVVGHERLSLDPTRPLLGKPTACVGRERELAILNASLAECAHGEGPKVVLVTAGAGTGKSRLRHEFVRRLGTEAAPRVLLCRGDPMHSTTPYAMIAQAIHQAAGLRDEEPPELVREHLRTYFSGFLAESDVTRVSDFVGELLGAGFDDAGNLPLRAARGDTAAMTDQIGRAVEDILRGWCVERPVVVVLEDLQWGDDPSVRLLDRGLRRLPGSRLLVLALARPEVHERFPSLFANRDVIEIRLPPIPKRACAKLVRDAMGEGPSDVEVERLVEHSEGNAFCLEELIRAAVQRPRGTATNSSASRDDDLPETVIAVAQARLERLEPGLRKVLRAASIFGDRFWVEGVSALVGQDVAALEPAISSLVEQEALAASEQPRFVGMRELTFRHALLRGTAYATLTESDRQLGHRLAAQWLERLPQEDGEVVALHLLEAGDRTRASECFSRTATMRSARAQAESAARCAARALVVGDAAAESVAAIGARVSALARALEASRSLDAREVVRGIERYVQPFDPGVSNASHALLRAILGRSLEVLRAGSDDPSLPGVLADAACAFGALADFVSAKRLLAEASSCVGEDSRSSRQVHYASAKIASWAVELGTTVALLEETVLPAEPHARLEMLLLFAMAVVMVDGRAALDRGLDLVSRAEAILTVGVDGEPPREDPVALAQCAKHRYICFVFAGEYAKAAEASEAGIEIARRAGLRFQELAHLHNAGEQYLRLGDRTRARSLIEQSNDIALEMGSERNQRHNDVLLAYLDGRPDLLEALAENARTESDAWLELYGRYWLGHLLASGRAPEARPALERALHLAGNLNVRIMADECTQALATLSAP